MLDVPAVRALIRLAIEEDLGAGDLTSELTLGAGTHSAAVLHAKEPLVMCGGPLIALVFQELHRAVEVQLLAAEGDEVEAGARLAALSGETRTLLSAERTILNFLQHLCGVASETRRIVRQADGMTVLDTRKTTPGWRMLEKYAVRIGGGRNHRANLSEMILVKNNHIDANGGDVAATLARVQAGKPWYAPVEVEVRDLHELGAALECGVQNVMLDNMNDELLSQSLALIRTRAPECVVEVSGRVQGEALARLKSLGVTCVSTSAMVTAAKWVDISMKLERPAP